MAIHRDLDRASLTIVAPATIARAADIRDQIAAAAAEASAVEIDIEAEEIDLAVLQVLISAGRSMRDRGGILTLAHPPAGRLSAMLAEGGFTQNDTKHQSWTVEVSQ